MNRFSKHLKVTLAFGKIHIANMFVYKTPFFLQMILTIGYAFFWIVFWRVIFSKTDILGQWTLGDMIVLLGFSNLWLAIFIGVYEGLWELPGKIIGGERLEIYLTRPINSLYALVCEEFMRYSGFENLIVGLILIITAKVSMGVECSILSLLLSFLVLFLGVSAFCMLGGTIGCLSFFVGPMSSVLHIIDLFDEFTRYPLNELERYAKLFLTFCIPSIFLSTYPSMIFLEKLEYTEIIPVAGIALGLAVFWACVLYVVYNRALRSYQSFGG
ncbi:MAG: ABC-2 family transporter protein [Theionarchaea archaeon]|nr:ABC-2 family transporter protein [Theionarchaea archaeon]